MRQPFHVKSSHARFVKSSVPPVYEKVFSET
jgi:hypothetical protein